MVYWNSSKLHLFKLSLLWRRRMSSSEFLVLHVALYPFGYNMQRGKPQSQDKENKTAQSSCTIAKHVLLWISINFRHIHDAVFFILFNGNLFKFLNSMFERSRQQAMISVFTLFRNVLVNSTMKIYSLHTLIITTNYMDTKKLLFSISFKRKREMAFAVCALCELVNWTILSSLIHNQR